METLCRVGRIRRKTKPIAGRCTSQEKPIKKRTIGNHQNAFLNHSFQAFWASYGNKERAEKEFFCSLSNICHYYDITVPDVSREAFPQNIYKAWSITVESIQRIDKKLDCIILKDERHIATMATVSQFDTNMTLYYIPVRPLWNWVQSAKQQDLAEVVVAIFTYLHQVVRIDWFTEPGSYLRGQYHYVEQMIHEDEYDYEVKDDDTIDPMADEDKVFREVQLAELYTLQNAGHHLYRKISHSETLKQMADTVLEYSCNEQRDNEWAILAIEFVQLYRQYPERSFFDHIHPDLYYPEIEERICADQYISFYWSGNDCVYDTVSDIIDCEFQEKGVIDEPITVEIFDSLEHKGTDNFKFEACLLALINRLVDLLNKNDYSHDERE